MLPRMSTIRSDDENYWEQRLIGLVGEISKANQAMVPRILLGLKDILGSSSPGSAQSLALKGLIWKYELFAVMTVSLKQDFSRVADGWNVSHQLASILVNSSIGLNLIEFPDFKECCLPDILESCLILACKLQKRYIKTSLILEDVKAQMLCHFLSTLDSISLLLSGYEHLAKLTLESAWFLQLLLTDDLQTGLRIMTLLQSINRQRLGILGQLKGKIGNQILDELVYKLSDTNKAEIASASAKSMLSICESHPPIINIVCNRYKGLKILLKKWAGKPFIGDLQRLLDAGDFKQAEIQKLSQSVRLIQACWRSYQTRKQLKKTDSAISKFQRSFRLRKEREDREKQEQKMESELQHMLLMQRKYTMRQLHKRQLCAIEILPASQVEKYLANEQTRAAIKIQAAWKGHQTKKTLSGRRAHMSRLKAAIKIQRMVRKWLDRVHAKKVELPCWQRPPGLTEDRRAELQAKILEWREARHQAEPLSRDKQELLHQKVQDMLRCNAAMSKVTRRNEQHREALLGRIEMDCTLLLNAPKFDASSESCLSVFVSHSVPVATKARLEHVEELQRLQQPWWKKISDQYQDDTNVQDSESWKVF